MIQNINKVFKIFEKNYQPIPIEVFTDPYKILISVSLSARTRDETTLAASNRLFAKAPNIKSLNLISVEEIENLIFPVAFYKTKAKNLKRLAFIIVNENEGYIPNKVSDLIKLPGVGIKTANLVVNKAFGVPAIAVDTHVHKISNLLGWINTKTPEESGQELHKIIPKKYWTPMNRLFVSIGRQFQSRNKLIAFLKKEELI